MGQPRQVNYAELLRERHRRWRESLDEPQVISLTEYRARQDRERWRRRMMSQRNEA